MANTKSSSTRGRRKGRTSKSTRGSRTRAATRRQRLSAGAQPLVNQLAGGVRRRKPAALAAGATAALAGAIAIRSTRRSQKRVLGLPVPTSARGLRSFVSQIGKASKQAGSTGKEVGREIQRLGEEAEQLGKTLS